MKPILVYDENNSKCNLLAELFNIIGSKKNRDEMSKNGISIKKEYINMMKVIFISIFYQMERNHVVNELNNNEQLRNNFGIYEEINIVEMNKRLSSLGEENIRNYVTRILNQKFPKPKKKIRTILIDSSPIPLDINTNKKHYSDEELEEKGFPKGFSSSKKFFIGYKLVLCMDYETKQPLYMSIEKGAAHDVNFFIQALEELKNRHILEKESMIIADKGYFKYDHYKKGLLDYKIVPLIYPRSNIKLNNIYNKFNHRLEHFNEKLGENNIYKRLLSKLKELLPCWEDFTNIRWEIEDFFNFMKNGVGYNKYHQYTYKSVSKNVFLVVLVAGFILTTEFGQNKTLKELTIM
jgi:hypothetical protein